MTWRKLGKRIPFILLLSFIINPSQANAVQTNVNFNYTGSSQTWTVPSGITSITFDVRGAGGKNVVYSGNESLGGRVQGTLTVTPGATLTFYVGGQATSSTGGYNGGGNGGNANGGGGGGASDIRDGGTKLIVAGGGGGTGNNCGCSSDKGGNGGGVTGANAVVGGGGAAGGGTSSSGGTGGTYSGYTSGTSGSSGSGGNGGTGTNGGGGGGGYYGGGGAAWWGGGGGSSYTHPTLATVVTHTQGYQSGNGYITISYGDPVDTTPPTFTSSSSFSVSENISTTSVAATITVSESSTITISSGVDASLFNIYFSDTLTAQLKFKSSPDYEAPLDSGGNNVFDLVISATDTAGNSATQAITITVTNLNEASTISSVSTSGPIYKGLATNLTATTNVAGRVRFFVDGKRISTCMAVVNTGSYPSYTATCTWKPPLMSSHSLTATLTPTNNTFSSSTSVPSLISITRRTSIR